MICPMCGDETTTLNDYPHHQDGCIARRYKYLLSEQAVGQRLRELHSMARLITPYVSCEVADDRAIIALGTALGPIADELVRLEYLERTQDGGVRMPFETEVVVK